MVLGMKGIYKGFKFISQIFAIKEKEMEIGYPTDVKHVAHIGGDGPSGAGSAPSWINEFKTPPDFSATTLGNIVAPKDSAWSSQDFEHSMGRRPGLDIFQDTPPKELAKKYKWKKMKSTPSSKSSSSRSLRVGKLNTNLTGS